jgi:hypothetical protein
MSDPTGPAHGRHEQGRPQPYPATYTLRPPDGVPPVYTPVPPSPVPEAPPATSESSRNLAVIVPWALVGLLSVALAVTLFLWLGPSGTTTHDVTVTFMLTDADTAGAGCVGQGGYSDIGAGTPVTIKSGSGDILGASELGAGTAAAGSCLWTVKIPAVPLGQPFYSAEVGRRGAITSSAAELKSNGYAFEVSLGQ